MIEGWIAEAHMAFVFMVAISQSVAVASTCTWISNALYIARKNIWYYVAVYIPWPLLCSLSLNLSSILESLHNRALATLIVHSFLLGCCDFWLCCWKGNRVKSLLWEDVRVWTFIKMKREEYELGWFWCCWWVSLIIRFEIGLTLLTCKLVYVYILRVYREREMCIWVKNSIFVLI